MLLLMMRLQRSALCRPAWVALLVAACGNADRDPELLPVLRGRAHPAGARAARVPDIADALCAAVVGDAQGGAALARARADAARAGRPCVCARPARGATSQARWSEIGAGVLWAFASGASMAVVYYLNTYALKAMDGRVRTFAMTAVTAALMIAGGAAASAIVLPADATGWLGLATPHHFLLHRHHLALLRAAAGTFDQHRRAQLSSRSRSCSSPG